MEGRETTPGGSAKAACLACGGRPRWESVVEGEEERWLGVCRCGRIRAFLPTQPSLDPDDPLRGVPAGGGTAGVPRASPPWLRLFLGSVEGPDPARWRFVHEPCRGCGVLALFRAAGVPAGRGCYRGVRPLPSVRLRGPFFFVVAYAARGGAVESAEGGAWAPACPAVQRLRDCVHRPYSLLRVGGVARREPGGGGVTRPGASGQTFMRRHGEWLARRGGRPSLGTGDLVLRAGPREGNAEDRRSPRRTTAASSSRRPRPNGSGGSDRVGGHVSSNASPQVAPTRTDEPAGHGIPARRGGRRVTAECPPVSARGPLRPPGPAPLLRRGGPPPGSGRPS